MQFQVGDLDGPLYPIFGHCVAYGAASSATAKL